MLRHTPHLDHPTFLIPTFECQCPKPLEKSLEGMEQCPCVAQGLSATGIIWGVAITEVGATGDAGSSSNASSVPPSWIWRGQEGL